MGIATNDDVNLVLRLYELRREEKLREARKWFTTNFKVTSFEQMTQLCPPGSDAHQNFRMVTTYWEMVASFMTAGVLNKELFFQSGTELLLVWERIRDVVPGMREVFKNPAVYHNLELVAHDFIDYMGPEPYKAFSARMR